VRNARGQVQKIVEQKDASKAQLKIRECNTGVLVAPAKRLKRWLGRSATTHAARVPAHDVIAMAVKDKVKVNPLVSPTLGRGAGRERQMQLAELEALRRAQVNRDLLLAGVTMADPTRVDVRGTLTHASDVFIDVGVVFEGRVSLGNRVRIVRTGVIRDSHIGDDTRCTAIASSTAPRSRRLFDRSVLALPAVFDARRHGAHRQLRRSEEFEDGEGSKANHLAYVGDADVGARVNIGAGTIVANYDGANKHRTTIGNDVQQGLEQRAHCADHHRRRAQPSEAGVDVANQAPAGKLTVARARQVTIEGWKRPTKRQK